MTRKQLFEWVKEEYDTAPDYPWQDWNAVLRHKDSRKWYGLVMEVERSKLGMPGTHVGGLEISQMKKSVLSTKGTTEIMTYLQENFHKTNNVEFAAFVGGEKRPYVCITLTKIDDVTGEKSKYYHVFFEKNRHVCHAWFDEDVIDQEVEKHIISLLIEK